MIEINNNSLLIVVKLQFHVLATSTPWVRMILFYSRFIDFIVICEIRGGTKLQI